MRPEGARRINTMSQIGEPRPGRRLTSCRADRMHFVPLPALPGVTASICAARRILWISRSQLSWSVMISVRTASAVVAIETMS